MLFSNPTVISQKIQQESLIKVKAFFASVGVHGSVAAALLYLSVNEPHDLPMDGRPVTISLANYMPAGKSTEPIVKKVTQPKKAAVKPTPKLRQKQKPVNTAKAQSPKKVVAPAPVTTPQPIPSPDPAVLAEASSPQPAEMRPGVAPSSLEPTAGLSSHEDLNSTHHSPQTAPSTGATKIVNNDLSAAEIDGATLGRIRTLIENALTYPAIARKLKLEGTVLVSFKLQTDGIVEKIELLETSGSSLLDTRALQTVAALNGEYPKLPETTFLKIPIAFTLTTN